jgi:hypothetical protein
MADAIFPWNSKKIKKSKNISKNRKKSKKNEIWSRIPHDPVLTETPKKIEKKNKPDPPGPHLD